MDTTFICEVCGHELPAKFQHEERPGVCFLDYVSDADMAAIKEAVDEACALPSMPVREIVEVQFGGKQVKREKCGPYLI